MDVERILVTKIARTQSMKEVLSKELEPHHFLQRTKGDTSPTPLPGEVYGWMCDHLRRYKAVPSTDLTVMRWPSFEFLDDTNTMEVVLDLMVGMVKRRELIEGIRNLSQLADDPTKWNDAEIHAFAVAADIARAVPSSSVTRLSDSFNRMELHKEMARIGRAPGITLVGPDLDSLTYGIQPGELMIWQGFLGGGKSTLSMIQSAQEYAQNGLTSLIMSLEMEGQKMANRWDAAMAGFKYRSLKFMEMRDEDYEAWARFAERAHEARFEKDVLVVDDIQRCTAERIFAEVEKWQPDFFIVDTVDEIHAPNYLKSHWERGDYAARELKAVCRVTKKPGIGVAQAGRDAEEEGAKLNNMAQCVPLSTEILTQRGWLSHDAVVAGDLTIGYDPSTGRSRWTKVLDVVHHSDQPTVSLGHAKWVSVVTPEHRWVTDTRSRKGRVESMTKTSDLSCAHRVRLSAEFSQPESAGELDAELVGWLWGDGSVFDNTGGGSLGGGATGFNMIIYQAKPHGLALLHELLSSIPHKDYVSGPSALGQYPKHTFRIRSKWAREMWSRTGLDRLSPEEFVLTLGPKGIQALLRGLWGAEGWMNGAQRIMAQNRSSPYYNAMVLAIYLGGHRPCISSNGMTSAGNENLNIHFGGQHVTGQWLDQSLGEVQDVWCVMTELGSWTMRQGDHVCLTGNSITIARKADIVVGLHSTPQMKRANQLELRMLKNRDGEGDGLAYTYYRDPASLTLRKWTPADSAPPPPAQMAGKPNHATPMPA